jgi:ubiquinone/menaquinone biosynthesis C-methylase UbiE
MDSMHSKVALFLKGEQGRILDAGAGEGDMSKVLHEMGFEVFPCDIEPSGFKFGALNCVKADLNKGIPYKNSYFNHAICIEVVEHLENIHFLLEELNRVIKVGGSLVISTPNIANVFSRLKFLFSGKFFCFSDEERRLGHLNPIAWWEMKEALKKHGFRVEKISSNAHLMLSGCDNASSILKRSAVRFAYILLYPFIKPKNTELLKGDSLVFMVEKVK